MPERNPRSRPSNFLRRCYNSHKKQIPCSWSLSTASLCSLSRENSPRPLAVGCPPPRPQPYVHTSPHLLIKVLVYFQACSTSLQAPQRLGPQQIHPDILRIGVQKPRVLNGCQGLKTTGVPKVSQNRESWSPPCPGHILPGHCMEERPHRPQHPRGHGIREATGSPLTAEPCRARQGEQAGKLTSMDAVNTESSEVRTKTFRSTSHQH